MKIVHYLQSINYENKTGVFFVRTPEQTNWTKINVTVSPLLIYRALHFKKERRLPVNNHYIGTVFVSDINSPKYTDSPFCLKHFYPSKGISTPENFRLECVDEVCIPLKDIVTNKIIGYKETFKRTENYLRYVRNEVTKELDKNTKFVDPQREYVPV